MEILNPWRVFAARANTQPNRKQPRMENTGSQRRRKLDIGVTVSAGNVKSYNVHSGVALPDFLLSGKSRKELRNSKTYVDHMEILQDFEFRSCGGKIKISPNEEFVVASGVYPPEIRIFEVAQQSLKCKRGLDSEVVDVEILSKDYRQLALLQNNRTVEFHGQGGRHFRARIPIVGRQMEYVADTANLWVVGSAPEIYRIDLEEGTFDSPSISQNCKTLSTIVANPILPCVYTGGGGCVEAWDIRDPSAPFSKLLLPTSTEVTCIDVDSRGKCVAVGTSKGYVNVYDIRSSIPISTQDHNSLNGIVDVHFMETGISGGNVRGIASADSHLIKLWNYEMEQESSLMAAVESMSKIHSVALWPSCPGLMFVGTDSPKMSVFFTPSISLAPKWCGKLDLVVEELENEAEKNLFTEKITKSQADIFSGKYHFVTREQLRSLHCEELIGTSEVKPHAHGYFIDSKAYFKYAAISNQDTLEEYRRNQIDSKIKSMQSMRLQNRVRKTDNIDGGNVNRKLMKVLKEKVGKSANFKEKKERKVAESVISDPRFADIFRDSSFELSTIDDLQ